MNGEHLEYVKNGINKIWGDSFSDISKIKNLSRNSNLDTYLWKDAISAVETYGNGLYDKISNIVRINAIFSFIIENIQHRFNSVRGYLTWVIEENNLAGTINLSNTSNDIKEFLERGLAKEDEAGRVFFSVKSQKN